MRDSVWFYFRFPGTHVPGFPVPPLRGWSSGAIHFFPAIGRCYVSRGLAVWWPGGDAWLSTNELASTSRLYDSPLLGMPVKKPTRSVTRVWEKAVHTSLLHWWVENQLGLSVLVLYRGVVFDSYTAKGLALRRHTISKHAIVRPISDSEQAHAS